MNVFKPFSYPANLSATTIATTQYVAKIAGAKILRVRNLDATNYARIAFGKTSAEAVSNVAAGIAVEAGQVELIGMPDSATYFAYVGDTGTCALNVQQGTLV